MFWTCIQYSDGTRVHHVFRRCMVYVVGDKLHVFGDAVCGTSFSHDTSGDRVDVTDGLVYGFDVLTAPLDHCERCRDTARTLLRTRAKAIVYGPSGEGN